MPHLRYLKKLHPFRPFIGLLIIGLVLSFYLFTHKPTKPDEKGINDKGRLNPTTILKIEKNKEVEGLKAAIDEARQKNLRVSIAGKRHSMGGHTFYKDAVVLDMTSFNKIISIDPEDKTIRVQSGATWDQIIEALDPYDLSIPVLQDYSGFTVGGSLSVNVHHSNPQYGPIIEIVKSFRLLLPNGSIVDVSRSKNPELFRLVIGGYGLFGIILDVDLTLTENKLYQREEKVMRYSDYPEYFAALKKNGNVEHIFARLSIVKNSSLLDELIVTSYRIATPSLQTQRLEKDKNLGVKKFMFDLSRKSDLGKMIRWYFQKNASSIGELPFISRNNLDYNDMSFLDYASDTDTDILQEYFFPQEQLILFIDKLREFVKREKINLLNATIRYVPFNDESILSYSNHGDVFAVVLYMNVGTGKEAQKEVTRWTQELTDYTISIGGTYYLPYQLYATDEQIRRAYPNLETFFAKKKIYDPQELFVNTFYMKYVKK